MHRVVLDMDPGIDDAVALLLALNNPELDVAAVTIVSGNVNVRKGTANALRLMDATGKHIPVYVGASRPSGSQDIVRAESVHGRDGLGDAGLPAPKMAAERIGADGMFRDLLKSSRKREVTIVATGPLTNVASLVKDEPSLLRKLDRIFVMGGLYDPSVRGNVTEYSEFNFFSDPISADRVMSAAGKDIPAITAAGLEVTSIAECAVDSRYLGLIKAIRSKSSEIARKILNLPVLTYSYFNLHDVFALFALVHPDIFTTDKCNVRVAHSGNFKGRCTVTAGTGGVSVCRKVNAAKFNQMVLDGLRTI